ncbi:MAG: threonine synthase [Candidatus Hydrogenedentes bacterium]|nr:threonine synthase [Candidatus Hydrogenedentota bacterium]
METSKSFKYRCYTCGYECSLSKSFHCPHCGDPMALRALGTIPEAAMKTVPGSLWHYAALLPVEEERNVVSLGEGATPLVDAARLAEKWGMDSLQIKNETVNPTGSFKDRQLSVSISHAKETGRDTVAVVSSGNVAVATAAYAARAGMKAVLFMHGQAGAGKIAQAAAYGAQVICVDSPRPSEVFTLCIQACDRFGWAHLSTSGMHNPYSVEGAKTIAYELYQQYAGHLPDWIVAPVGGGGLLGGIWRGLLDLQRMGYIEKLPRLAGIQAAGCAPLKQALEQDWSFQESLKHPWENPETVAGGIADDILFDGHTVLPAIRETNGIVLAVDDDAIRKGVQTLAHAEGLFCELTTAVVIAAMEKNAERFRNQNVACILTGHGLKDLAGKPIKDSVAPPHIPPELEALERLLGV